MKQIMVLVAGLVLVAGVAIAQSGDSRPTPPTKGEGGGHRPPPPPPLLVLLDKDKDGELSAEEIANAPAVLLTLDKNGDGVVDVSDLGILAANYGTGTGGADFAADYAKVFGTSAGSDGRLAPALHHRSRRRR